MCDEHLLKACERFRVSFDETPETFAYTPFSSILQKGPQCGLIALAMYCKLSETEIAELQNVAKSLCFTINGEIFSAEYMYTLAQRYINKEIKLYSGSLEDKAIENFLLQKGMLLVPYDADANHSPCLRNGHKAHWALISGIIISKNKTFVIARQGKSKHLGIWPLQDLAASNSQLNEFSPSREQSKLEYKLPEGGISGPKGLKNRCVLIYN